MKYTAKYCDFKMTEAGTSKRKDLSLSDKILVIGELDKKASQSAVANKFGISQSQVSRILKSKEKFLSAQRSNVNPSRKRARKSTHEDLEQGFPNWGRVTNFRGRTAYTNFTRKSKYNQKNIVPA
ncbi:unnamed protein product [Clavelina lepadiformis]|uniref:HTH psq-type domain-containing protein n=1 Tax=Clavelina lepadiformis TaxID=159417 RepID=A0ABP0FCU9_CLALP